MNNSHDLLRRHGSVIRVLDAILKRLVVLLPVGDFEFAGRQVVHARPHRAIRFRYGLHDLHEVARIAVGMELG